MYAIGGCGLRTEVVLLWHWLLGQWEGRRGTMSPFADELAESIKVHKPLEGSLKENRVNGDSLNSVVRVLLSAANCAETSSARRA